MFIIEDGQCSVISGDGKVELAALSAGDHFGEIDLVLGSRRIATVKTITYCTLLVLKRLGSTAQYEKFCFFVVGSISFFCGLNRGCNMYMLLQCIFAANPCP